MRGKSLLARRKWPRWFVPICSSKPSAVRSFGVCITPALFTSASSVGQASARAAAHASTLFRLARSRRTELTDAEGTRRRISARAVSAFLSLREVITTRAPLLARMQAASSPRPELPPVIAYVLPSSEGSCAGVQPMCLPPRAGS